MAFAQILNKKSYPGSKLHEESALPPLVLGLNFVSFILLSFLAHFMKQHPFGFLRCYGLAVLVLLTRKVTLVRCQVSGYDIIN